MLLISSLHFKGMENILKYIKYIVMYSSIY